MDGKLNQICSEKLIKPSQKPPTLMCLVRLASRIKGKITNLKIHPK